MFVAMCLQVPTATHWYTLCHTAIRCNTLQQTATHCKYILQLTATHCQLSDDTRDLWHVSAKAHYSTLKRCNTLQHTATHCIALQRSAAHYKHAANTLQHTVTHRNTLQHSDATHITFVKHLQLARLWEKHAGDKTVPKQDRIGHAPF